MYINASITLSIYTHMFMYVCIHKSMHTQMHVHKRSCVHTVLHAYTLICSVLIETPTGLKSISVVRGNTLSAVFI